MNEGEKVYWYEPKLGQVLQGKLGMRGHSDDDEVDEACVILPNGRLFITESVLYAKAADAATKGKL